MLDVVVLAGLYTLRIIAGAAAMASTSSFWLLAFSMFLFLSLALVKRYTELDELRKPERNPARTRLPHVADLPLLAVARRCQRLSRSVLVLALYINSTA